MTNQRDDGILTGYNCLPINYLYYHYCISNFRLYATLLPEEIKEEKKMRIFGPSCI